MSETEAKQGTETKVLSLKEQKDAEREKNLQKKALKAEVEELELLAKYYQLKLALPQLVGKYLEMEKMRQAEIDRIEKEGEPDEESDLILPEGGLVDMNGNKL